MHVRIDHSIVDTVVLDGEITTNVSRRLLSFIYVPAMICAYASCNTQFLNSSRTTVFRLHDLLLNPSLF